MDVLDVLINLPRDANDRPLDPPLLDCVDIFDSDQDATLTFIARDGLDTPANVTVTLDDGNGNQTQHTFTVSVLGVDDPGDVFVDPGGTTSFAATVTGGGGATIQYAVATDQTGATVTVDAAGQVEVTPPADFSGSFRVLLSANREGETVLSSRAFYVFSQPGGDPPLVTGLPTSPVGSAVAAVRAGDRLYCACGVGGLEVYDISNVADPVRLGVYYSQGEVRDVEVLGSTAYVADMLGGLLVLNVSDPADITLRRQIDAGGPVVDLLVHDGTLFVAAGEGGFQSYDLSVPTSPRRLDTLVHPVGGAAGVQNAAVALTEDGRYALVTDLNGGLLVVEVNRPDRLRVRSAWRASGGPWGVAVAGDRMYLAVQGAGLLVADIRHPYRPNVISVLPMDGLPWQVRVVNQVAVVGNFGGGFTVVDVYDPRNMRVDYELSSVGAGGLPALAGADLFLPVGGQGVVLMDADQLVCRTRFEGAAVLTDGNGVDVRLALRQATGVAYTTAPGGGSITRLEIDPASARACVKITTAPRLHTVIDTIVVSAFVDRFDARTVDLGGEMTFAGGVDWLYLGDVADDHTITLADSGNPRGTFVDLGRVSGLTIDSDVGLRALRVIDWLRDGDDVVRAPWLRELCAKGSRALHVPGNFQADLEIGAEGDLGETLGTARVAGDLSDCAWDVLGGAGRIDVKGTAARCTVRTSRGMDAVTLGAADQADFLAGIADGVARHAADADTDFAAAVRIGTFKVVGLRAARRQGVPRWFFTDSNVSAARLGTVDLLNVQADNDGVDFGLWALDAAATTDEIALVRYADTVTGAKAVWPRDAATFPDPDQDFRIEVLQPSP